MLHQFGKIVALDKVKFFVSYVIVIIIYLEKNNSTYMRINKLKKKNLLLPSKRIACGRGI